MRVEEGATVYFIGDIFHRGFLSNTTYCASLGEDAVSFPFDCNVNSYYYVKVEGMSSGSHGPYELVVKAE